MKASEFAVLIIAIFDLCAAGCSRERDEIQGRPLATWVSEYQIWNETNPANEVIDSAGPQILPQLAGLLNHSSFARQTRAAAAIGDICYHNPNAPQNSDVVPALTAIVHSRNSELRIYSVQALGAIGKPASNAVPDLIELTRDSNDSVRMCAVEALGRVGANSSESVTALTTALSDTSSDVRICATNAIVLVQNSHE